MPATKFNQYQSTRLYRRALLIKTDNPITTVLDLDDLKMVCKTLHSLFDSNFLHTTNLVSTI